MERQARIEHPLTTRQVRGQWARVTTAVCVAALGSALLQLQLLHWEAYELVARENRMRPVVVPAPRGTIYDRSGQIVAENVVGYRVLLMPAPQDSMVAKLERLRPILGLTDRDVERALRRWHREPHLPMEVKRDAAPGAVARLEERRFLEPGVLVHEYPKRRYPAGRAIAHIVGYVAEISREELALPEFRGYRQGRWIGKTGLERYYEAEVGGEPGMRYLEMDALGRILGWVPEGMGIPSVPGQDLRLHLDLDLQRYMMTVFPPGARGGFAAIDPRTGGVLALYSAPNYDPNLLVGGIDPEMWAQLSQDPSHPLLDRAAGAAQPPGSTFKLATAAIAMQAGVLGPGDRMPIPCTGGLRYERRFARCWYGRGHGSLDLTTAIQRSCNVYFYQVGIRLGLTRFLEEGSRLGFGGRTGIDLPSELASTFPSGIEAWQQRFGYRPADNEVMSLTIGQGLVTLTPLKLAQIFVALARLDGNAPAPRLVQADEETPITLDLNLSEEQVLALRRGLRRVPGPGGTAQMSRLPHWDFLGKTGTAQNPHGPDHGLFVAIAGPPGEEPEIVAAIIVEHGEAGSRVGPFAANAVNFYLNRKHGRPFERFPTPRERLARDLPIDWSWFNSPVNDPQ